MHPLEQLRYLARSWEVGDELPAQEAAEVLGDLAGHSPGSLVQACRRLIEYFPACGQAWWLAARTLSSPSPEQAAWEAAEDLASDPTPQRVARAVPDGSAVCAVPARHGLLAALARHPGTTVQKKPRSADLVLVTAAAARATPRSFFARPGDPSEPTVLVGGRAASAVRAATAAAKPVWVVVPRGALLPAPLWEHLLGRSGLSGTDREDEREARAAGATGPEGLLGAGSFAAAVGELGAGSVAEVLAGPTCPAAAELVRWTG